MGEEVGRRAQLLPLRLVVCVEMSFETGELVGGEETRQEG
jgi:hypothetical protein